LPNGPSYRASLRLYPVEELKTTAGKLFAGTYAIFSGLVIIIATGFLLAPIFHRVLHRFHVETTREKD
jgi:hypothetical protein